MRKFNALLICLLFVGCASRPDTAPIENATNVPSYLSSSGNSSGNQSTKPAATPAKTNASNHEGAGSSTTMGALSDNENSVKSVPVHTVPVNTVSNNKHSASYDANNTSVAGDASDSAAMRSVTAVPSAASGWIMPTTGKASSYKSSSKGIDIYGVAGQAIYAVNDGKVVYSGNGLKGYGNLIIIKHDDTYLTAYAHNKMNKVSEGAIVKRGQKIATMGTDDDGSAVLHFEVRKNGKPIDPFSLIKG
ncbi:MAG: lipoprotein NlpD [Pseudomonadota bacterium]|nr:lipoprotein NlpD [Pseudomonadota bacterium]